MALNLNPANASQFISLWRRLTPKQKWLLGLSSAFALLFTAWLFYLALREDYQLLYSELQPEDANSVVSKLKVKKIPYRLAESGTAIKVPSDKLAEARLELASDGLPRSGRMGFEIFDKTSWGVTDFAEQVNYRRALEGELERTIRSLVEVQQARVHLALPKDSLFLQQKEESKASVVIKLKGDRELSPQSISGIRHLVASAVEGLRPENVSIVDAHGRMLSHSPLPDNQNLSLPELELVRSVERELANKVVAILEPVVGVGKVRANAAVELSLNTTEQTEEIYDPSRVAILSQQKTQEEIPRVYPAGVPGTRSNQQDAGARSAGPPLVGYKQNEVTNYEISKTVRRTLIPKGEIKRLSLAVVIDDKTIYNKDKEGKVTVASAPRTPEEIEHIRGLVQSAVGYNQARGDRVTVENISFDLPAPLDEEPKSFLARNRELVRLALKYLSVIVLFGLIYLTLLRPIRRKISDVLEGEVVGEERPLELQPHPAERKAPLQALPSGSETPSEEELEAEIEKIHDLVDAGLKRSAILKRKMQELAKKKPELAAQAIRIWLNESKS